MELDLYFMIIYLCMKYESNTPMYSKDIARKPFFVRTGRTEVRTYGSTDVRTRVMLYAPPHYKWRGHNKGSDEIANNKGSDEITNNNNSK